MYREWCSHYHHQALLSAKAFFFLICPTTYFLRIFCKRGGYRIYNTFYPVELVILGKVKHSRYRVSFTKPSKTEEQNGFEPSAKFSHLIQETHSLGRSLIFLVSDK